MLYADRMTTQSIGHDAGRLLDKISKLETIQMLKTINMWMDKLYIHMMGLLLSDNKWQLAIPPNAGKSQKHAEPKTRTQD